MAEELEVKLEHRPSFLATSARHAVALSMEKIPNIYSSKVQVTSGEASFDRTLFAPRQQRKSRRSARQSG